MDKKTNKTTTNETLTFTKEEEEIIERIAIAIINGEGFLMNKLWKTFFPSAHPLRNEKNYVKIIREIYKKEKEILSLRAKRKRIKKRLQQWEKKGDLYFTTLTFSNEALQNTTKEERRTAIIRDLNATSDNYIANADYGDLRGREHYHALILNLNKEALEERRRKIGYIDIKKIIRTLGLAIDYCMKLTNHTLKDSTDKKIIYCRKTKDKLKESMNLLEDDLEC